MIAVIDCGSKKVPYIVQAISPISEVKTFDPFDFHPKEYPQLSGVVISGAPILITEINLQPYLSAFEWIKSTQIPVLGICFGHQIIGLLHGANGAKMMEDRDWREVEFFEAHMLNDNLPKVTQMMQDHCEAISIPSDFRLIASSDVCVNEAMTHKSKSLFGVQFHPEVSNQQGTQLIQNFIQHCLKHA